MAISDYTTSVTLDISCNDPVTVVKAKQLDNMTRKIAINFVDETGSELEIPSGSVAEFRVQRPDGVMISTEDTTVGTTYVNVYLTDAMLEVKGRAIADIRIKQGSQVLSARAFFIDVYQTAEGRGFTGYLGTNAPNAIMTREQYDETTPSDTIVYYVRELDGTVTQYLGSIPISGGGSSSQASFVSTNIMNTINSRYVSVISSTITESEA